MQIVPKPDVLRETAIGIDFGVKTFLTFNDGRKIENPTFLEKSAAKLAKHQQDLAKLEKDTTKFEAGNHHQ